MSEVTTPDGRYIVVRGRLWRAANPHLNEQDRAEWTASLMRARRAVGVALRNGDDEAERADRRKVHRAKVRLGERGAVWWSDGTADFNRRLVRNSPYREWHQEIERWEAAILSMTRSLTSTTLEGISRTARSLMARSHITRMKELPG